MEKREGDLEEKIRQLEETVRSLQDQVRKLGGSPNVLPISNSLSQRVQDVTSRPSVLQQIKDLNPDSFQSKEQAREHFIELVVQYWNSVKPTKEQSNFNIPGIQVIKYPLPLVGIEIPISFFESKDVEKYSDTTSLKNVIVLPLFGVSPADLQPVYENRRQAGSQYDLIVRVLSPAINNSAMHRHVISGTVTDRNSLKMGGLKPGFVE